jgi:hypothetical protein
MAWYSKEFRRSFVHLIVYQPKPKPHLKTRRNHTPGFLL